jgi:hypothetical protein
LLKRRLSRSATGSAAERSIEDPPAFELLINLGTAKTLGTDVPTTVLAQTDGVIE